MHTITSKFGKAAAWFLITMIVMSFAAWGIGDVFRGHVDNAVAKVGAVKIPYDEYRETLHAETQKFQSAFPAGTMTDAMKAEISSETLNSLIRQKLLAQEISRLRIAPEDKDLVKIISGNPAFRDEKSGFSPERFKEFLARAGKSESTYLGELRRDLGFYLLMQSLTADRSVSEFELGKLYAISEQRRTAEIAYIPIEYNRRGEPSSEAELSAFYESHKQYFAIPETRDVSYMIIDPTRAVKIAITDAELHKEYERRKQEFSTPETRDLGNVIAKDEATAKDAYEKLKAGRDFHKLTGVKISLVKKARKDSLAPTNLADSAFMLENGGVSAPIKSPFGWHVIKVLGIYPPHVPGFEEVKGKLQAEMERASAGEAVNKFIQAIDDEAASGAKAEEVAKKFSLDLKKALRLKRGNVNPGKLETTKAFLDAAFSTPAGLASNVFGTAGGKYALVYVDSVQSARIPDFKDIQKEISDAYAREKAVEVAEKIANELAAQKDFKALAAKSINLEATTLDSIKSDYHDKNLPPEFIGEIFRLKENETTKPYRLENKFVVARLVAVKQFTGKSDTAALAKLKSTMAEKNMDDLITEYFEYLKTRYPVRIYKDAMKTAQ